MYEYCYSNFRCHLCKGSIIWEVGMCFKVIPQYCITHPYVRNERNFPQAKLNCEINVHFLLNEHGDLYFYCIIIVCILSSLIQKKTKKIYRNRRNKRYRQNHA